ncbi:MAG TPA: SigE family RNA polymerase sigma factor [Actinomycetes bacterium]
MNRGGDFDEFYRATFGRLVGQLFFVTADLHEAEDVVQEAMARASSRWSQLENYDLPEDWVRRVAMNLAIDGLRRARRRAVAMIRLGPTSDVPPISADGVLVATALRQLPLRYRRAVVLHYLVGLPVQEVARELGIPVATVKTHLARGRRALATQLRLDPQEVQPKHG